MYYTGSSESDFVAIGMLFLGVMGYMIMAAIDSIPDTTESPATISPENKKS